METRPSEPDTTRQSIEQPRPSRVLASAGAALVGAVLANLALRSMALAAGASAEFPPLGVGPIVVFTVLGCAAGTGVFFWIRRAARNPPKVWRIVAYSALVTSFIPDALLARAILAGGSDRFGGDGPSMKGADIAIVFLMLMHVATALLLTETLRRYGLGRPPPEAAPSVPMPRLG